MALGSERLAARLPSGSSARVSGARERPVPALALEGSELALMWRESTCEARGGGHAGSRRRALAEKLRLSHCLRIGGVIKEGP